MVVLKLPTPFGEDFSELRRPSFAPHEKREELLTDRLKKLIGMPTGGPPVQSGIRWKQPLRASGCMGSQDRDQEMEESFRLLRSKDDRAFDYLFHSNTSSTVPTATGW